MFFVVAFVLVFWRNSLTYFLIFITVTSVTYVKEKKKRKKLNRKKKKTTFKNWNGRLLRRKTNQSIIIKI